MSWCYGSLTILAVVATHLLMIRSVSSQNITNEYINHKCNKTQGTYSPGSKFEKHLNSIIHHISTLSLKKGYVYSSNEVAFKVSKDSNIAFVLLQCRGDSYGSKCLSCFNTALAELRKRCPGNRAAIIWYDQCLLDIANVNSKGRIHYGNNFWITNAKNATVNPKLFKEKRIAFFKKLSAEAVKRVNGDRGPLYAAGNTLVGNKKLYAMVQCTYDLSALSCEVCLEYMIKQYEDCCTNGSEESDCCNKAGVRAFGRSCNFRYEFYSFLRNPHRLL